MHTPVWLAVDLGTTHTVAVVGREGSEPRSLLFDGSPLLPSGVYLDADGTLHTGRDAQRLAASEPARFEPHPKRRIDEGTVLLGDREIPVEELLATGLRRVAEAAATSGQRPTETVLTYPADWGPVRRASLERAASIAGFSRVKLLAEPIAAATYCAEILGQEIPRGGAVAIFDFGGGTFDVAVVRREDDETGRFRTLAVGGLDDLGGLDVDMALAAHLGRIVAGRDPELWQRLSEPETTEDLRDRLAFWGEVRAAKEMLSRTSTAPVALPGHNPMGLHLTRDELQSLADPLVSRAVDETRRTVERAGVNPGELAALLLVGGSSRMPLVATRLHARLGVAPSVPEQPELPVAFGALRHALVEPEARATTPAAAPAPSPVPPVTYVPVPPSVSAPTPAAPQPVPPHTTPHANPQMTPQRSNLPPVYTGPLKVTGPRRPRRFSFLALYPFIIGLAVVLVIVYNQVDWAGLGEDGAGEFLGGLADGIEDVTGGGPDLPLVFEQQLDADGAGAVVAAEDLAVFGEVVTGATVVRAFNADGTSLWTQEYALEPTELYLTVVGDVLVIDALYSATDGGVTMRAAADLDTGELLWKQPWEYRGDVAFYGTSALVEQRDGFDDNAAILIDLTTGEEVWKRLGPEHLYTMDDYRVRAATVWNEGEGTGVVPANSYALYDNLVATDQVVDLSPEEGTAVVRDAATGEETAEGVLPIDDDYWTVFDGFVIGRASEEVSPGRDTLVAYSLTDFSVAWSLPLDAPFSIQHVKPCGPHLVCTAVDHSESDDQYKTFAVDTATGEQQWEVKVDWAFDDHWYSTPDGLILGDQAFDSVSEAQLLSLDGQQIVDGELFTSALAVRDGRAVMESSVMGGWEVAVMDMATGETSGAEGVGAELPEHASLYGDLLVVLTGDKRALVFTIPEL